MINLIQLIKGGIYPLLEEAQGAKEVT